MFGGLFKHRRKDNKDGKDTLAPSLPTPEIKPRTQKLEDTGYHSLTAADVEEECRKDLLSTVSGGSIRAVVRSTNGAPNKFLGFEVFDSTNNKSYGIFKTLDEARTVAKENNLSTLTVGKVLGARRYPKGYRRERKS